MRGLPEIKIPPCEFKASDGYKTKSGKLLERGAWHNFGGPCSYRVAPKRNSYSIRLDATGEVVRPGGPAGQDALMMAMYREERAQGYEHYAFGKEAA